MGGKTQLLVLFLVLLVAGCTPADESVVKKADIQGGELPGLASMDKGIEGIPAVQLDPVLRSFIKDHGTVVKRQAAKYGFDWRLILAMVKQESKFTTEALSQKGASGLMQLMPTTGEEVARSLSLAGMERPENNIKGGVFYLKTPQFSQYRDCLRPAC